MERPFLWLLRFLRAVVFINWTCCPLIGEDALRTRFLTMCHASCYLKRGTTWGRYKYIIWETEVKSPTHCSFFFLLWRLDFFFVLVILLGFDFLRQRNKQFSFILHSTLSSPKPPVVTGQGAILWAYQPVLPTQGERGNHSLGCLPSPCELWHSLSVWLQAFSDLWVTVPNL